MALGRTGVKNSIWNWHHGDVGYNFLSDSPEMVNEATPTFIELLNSQDRSIVRTRAR